MTCFIGLRMNYNLDRRLIDEFGEAAVFDPELFVIMIFGQPVFTMYTNNVDVLNTLFPCRRIRRLVGLHFRLVHDPLPGNPIIPVSCIQFCVNGVVTIYHMAYACDLPTAVRRFMDDPDNTFFGVNSELEWERFRSYTLYNGNIAYRSLGPLAALHFGQPELSNANLTQLTSRVLGEHRLRINVEEEDLLTMQAVDPDWDKHTLSDEQVMYAGISAYLSYEMGTALAPNLV